MSKFLITGGAGFIGSNYLHYVVDKYPEDEFVCLDALTYAGNYNNIKKLEEKPNYKFVKMDIRDKDAILELFKKEKFDYVINFAAESHVDNSIKNPNIFAETNILGTMNLLNAAKYMRDVENHPLVRYHQVSTDEVYGDLPLDRPDLYFTEETPIHTSSPYSASKAGADLLVLAYHRTFKLPVTISRCSNNYGPYQYPEKLIPFFISKLLRGEKVPVYGDGLNVRDWLYVYDHCAAIDTVLHKGKIGEVYNVGGHNEKTNMEITRLILEAMGKDESSIEYVQDRLGHDRRYAISNDKITSELGWEPSVTFEQGIKMTIDWYLNNQEWIKHIEEKKVGV